MGVEEAKRFNVLRYRLPWGKVPFLLSGGKVIYTHRAIVPANCHPAGVRAEVTKAAFRHAQHDFPPVEVPNRDPHLGPDPVAYGQDLAIGAEGEPADLSRLADSRELD